METLCFGWATLTLAILIIIGYVLSAIGILIAADVVDNNREIKTSGAFCLITVTILALASSAISLFSGIVLMNALFFGVLILMTVVGTTLWTLIRHP